MVFLHLYRRKPTTRIVSSVLLWEQHGQLYSAGRKRTPLHRSLSFWLEILCAMLLVLAITNPLGCWSSAREHHILIVDSSASMQVAEEWSILQNQLLDEIRQSNKRDVYTIIIAGSTATAAGCTG